MPLAYSPNLNCFFKQLPLPSRIGCVAELGFRHAEFWGWWDEDIAAIAAASRKHEVRIAAFCTKFVSLVDPATREAYLAGLTESIEAAKRLECPTLISQVGDERTGVPRAIQHEALVEGLRCCVPLLEKAGVTLTIEPLNVLVDHKGYYLARSEEAFEVIRKVDSPRVKVLFDVYHQQITEGNLIPNMTTGAEWIGHYHVADHPGRGDIGTGEINYPNVLKAIEKTGYAGTVGIELFPKGGDEQALHPFIQKPALLT